MVPRMDSNSLRIRHRLLGPLLVLLVSPSICADTLPSVPSFFEYNVCNGLSNQLLIHASAMAKAIKEGATVIQVPDYFIVNGEQTSDKPVLPLPENSVPLGVAFDIPLLERRLKELGLTMELVQNVGHIVCPELSWLREGDPQLVLTFLKAFQPSTLLSGVTRRILGNLAGSEQKGICFHHRDGKDWHDHCQRWSAHSAKDLIYRGNCEAVPHASLLELLQHRALTSKDRWIYYAGDHEIPAELKNETQLTVFNREQMLTDQDRDAVQALRPDTPVRDLWALVDFFVCRRLRYLVGNSVSTFSALQIALREQEGSYWYNSHSIPLGDMWDIYQIPIVYTYTELSDIKGKFMLQASIASLRQQMPRNKVYILYHGQQDKVFRQWLRDQSVTIFQHRPSWQDQIEQMRINGNSNTSHLFLNSGNYFGTWQRIDIPLFVETEYVLLLDADTVIMKPFTLHEFGLDLPLIGMSAERQRHHSGNMLNAGVTLMNVPHLRASYHTFLKYILDHVQGGANFNHPAPSDQGAYLDFYSKTVRQISNFWNWKAYWGVKLTKTRMFAQINILHFHGMKPHDYVTKIMGGKCEKAIDMICAGGVKHPFLRVAMKRFLEAASIIPNFHQNYCENSFETVENKQECVGFLDFLLGRDNVGAGAPKENMSEAMASTGESLEREHESPHPKLGVVTVSRPAAEENAANPTTIKIRELSYDYLNLPNQAFQQQISRVQTHNATVLAGQHMIFLLGTFSALVFYFYYWKQRGVLLIMICGSLAWRQIYMAERQMTFS